MRYVIYGAGGIGGVIGGKLHLAGHEVVLIARGAHLDAMRERGLTVETVEGSHVLPIAVAGSPSEVAWHDGDVVVLTIKTQHTEAALDALVAVAGPEVPIVCAQNGIENERIALRRFAHVYAMMVLLPATFLLPGVVQANCWPDSGVLDAGCYPAGCDHLIMRVAEDLTASGFPSQAVEDPMRWKYAKLLSNLGNALQAAVRPEDEARGLYGRLRDEAVLCYRAAGIAWASDDEMNERRRAMSRMVPIGGETRGGGSTWQSVARGAGSVETDYLNGEIVMLGRKHGIAAPANAAMQAIAHRLMREGMAAGSMGVEEIEREIAGRTEM